MRLFGTSGIRGLTGSFITNELAFRIGNLMGRNSTRIVVARDTRPSGPQFHDELLKGITDAGAPVIDIGIVPTPTLAFASNELNIPGIMITASHNPEEYNGFKIFKKGAEITQDEEKEFEEAYAQFIPQVAAQKGEVTADGSWVEKHITALLKTVDVDLIRSKKFKVVVDCNGAARTLIPKLLEALGCTVHALNMQETGFARPSEPNEKNLAHLKDIITKHNAHVAFAHDGDADRVVVFHPTGEMVPLDMQLALMAEYQLKQSERKSVISTVESSLLLRERVEKQGGKLLITRVSSTELSHRIIPENACFAGEPCGEYVYHSPVTCPDGPHAATVFLEMIATSGNLEELSKNYPQYPLVREKFACQNEKKYVAVEALVKEISIPGTKTSIDGLRVDEEDGWFLIRASGTEPAIRLTLEYTTVEKLNSRKEVLEKEIQRKIGLL